MHDILEDVRRRGDVALRDLTARFDGVDLATCRVDRAEIDRALDSVESSLRTALETAAAAIEAYHRQQVPADVVVDTDGLSVRGMHRPVDRAGCYVPGGRALYPSTVLMTAVPARVAGVDEVVLGVPPGLDGRVATATLAAAAIAGVDEVFAVGGAQAIGALAYGTETVRPVDVIVGPGNVYVAIAKQLVAGTVGVLASRRLAQQAAYLVVVSAGTLLTAFGLGGAAALAAGLYYLAHTTLAAAALFLLADVLAQARGEVRDRLVAGPSLPQGELLGGVFLLIALAVSGVPPLSGFIGKFLILRSSIGDPWMSWVVGVVLITSLLAIMALARSGTRLFFKIDMNAADAAVTRPVELTAPVLLVFAGIGLVVYAGPVYEFAHGAATQLVQPWGYVAAVLQSSREGGP